MGNTVFEGGCACGRITYPVKGDIMSMTWCFCKTCQKASGSAFLPFADFDTKDVTWSHFPESWSCSDIAVRYRCKDCGSALAMMYNHEPSRIGITVGTTNDKTIAGLKPTAYIFLKDKPSWFTLPDDEAERADEFNGDFDKRLAELDRSET